MFTSLRRFNRLPHCAVKCSSVNYLGRVNILPFSRLVGNSPPDSDGDNRESQMCFLMYSLTYSPELYEIYKGKRRELHFDDEIKGITSEKKVLDMYPTVLYSH